MTQSMNHGLWHPLQQQEVCDGCFHPSATFVEFPVEDVETAIFARFEMIVRLYPERLAVKDGGRSLTYEILNHTADRMVRIILALRGQGSESIALLFEHGVEVIAAILGSVIGRQDLRCHRSVISAGKNELHSETLWCRTD